MSRSTVFAYDRAMGTTPQTAPTPRSGAPGRTAAPTGGASGAAVPDPQTDEDDHVQHVRRRYRLATPVDVKELVRTWHAWAAYCCTRAHHADSHFAAQLLLTRAAVREEAAKLLLSGPPGEAARLMMQNAAAHMQRHAPLIGYDRAACEYTRARSWQFCAWMIDPDLPEVQPRWDG